MLTVQCVVFERKKCKVITLQSAEFRICMVNRYSFLFNENLDSVKLGQSGCDRRLRLAVDFCPSPFAPPATYL